jgi:hypothetical protein
MPITHDPETGWTFTLGQQTYTGYATKEEAQAAAYDLERGQAPQDSLLAEDEPDSAATVLAHIDQIAKTEEERQYVRTLCAEDAFILVDWANYLTRRPGWDGVKTSPGVNVDRASTDALAFVPRLTVRGDDLYVQPQGNPPEGVRETIESRLWDTPQKVYELITLKRRGLVVMDCEEEVIIMTHEECPAQEGFMMDEGAAELAKLPIEDRVFASIVRNFMAQLPESHRSMGEAGMLLLAAACDGAGAADEEGDDLEERSAVHVYRAAYEQGRQDGRTSTIDLIDRCLREKHGPR